MSLKCKLRRHLSEQPIEKQTTIVNAFSNIRKDVNWNNDGHWSEWVREEWEEMRNWCLVWIMEGN